jgi:hypothetical protein
VSLQLAHDEDPVDAAADLLVGVHQLDHRTTRRLDQDAARTGNGLIGARPARQQTHLAEELAAPEARADVWRLCAFERHFAVDDREEGSAELARLVDCLALTHDAGRTRLRILRGKLLVELAHLALRVLVLSAFRVRDDHVALDDQLAELQAVHLPEHRDQLLEALDHLVDRPLEGQAVELVFEQRVIGGLQVVAVDELDHVVALVHRLLDERVAGERADHVHAGDVALVVARQLRYGVGALVRKPDADRLDELARRDRAEARDDAAALRRLLAGGGLQDNRQRAVGALDDALDTCFVVAVEAAALIGDGRDHGVEVGVLGAAEFLAAVDDPDVVLLGQRQRVLDRRVAGADHQDRLVAEFPGIVQLVLHALQIFARRSELARIALEADRQHDVRGLHGLAVGELQVEGMLVAGDFADFRAVADVDAALLQPCRPPR